MLHEDPLEKIKNIADQLEQEGRLYSILPTLPPEEWAEMDTYCRTYVFEQDDGLVKADNEPFLGVLEGDDYKAFLLLSYVRRTLIEWHKKDLRARGVDWKSEMLSTLRRIIDPESERDMEALHEHPAEIYTMSDYIDALKNILFLHLRLAYPKTAGLTYNGLGVRYVENKLVAVGLPKGSG